MNNQPLKFLISHSEGTNDIIFPKLGWAGNLPDWPGPVPGERPSAYIILLGDTTISTNYFVDHGIMAQSMLLGAVEKGYGGCMLLSINRPELRKDLDLPEHLKIVLVVALGRPAENVVTEDIVDGKTGYYRDENDVHHVPKRTLEELIFDIR